MSNTPELNWTDCRHRQLDSAEVRSRNLLCLTTSRILAGVWQRDPENEVDWKLAKRVSRVPNVGELSGPRQTVRTVIAKLDPIHQRSVCDQKLNTTQTEENGNQMTLIHEYVVLSIRRVMDTLININRGMAKLCMPVYLGLSVRRSMETHIQMLADEKQNYVCMVISF